LAQIFKGSSFADWQRFISVVLVAVIVANTGLFSGAAYAQTYEVKLEDFRSESLEDLNEYGLVNVLAESKLLEDRSISGHVRQYCERVQQALGTVCTITPWEGETASRVVEALQQLYFEGLEVEDGIAKLVGLVVIGEVPLPVVHNGQDSFPSFFPYTDFVKPAYVFDPEQEIFVQSSSSQSQAEIWHGLIRPPGDGDSRLEALRKFFEKNALFYQGDEIFSVFRNQIGFHDQFWENDSFDNENKKWYLKKMSLLDRIMHYRYNGAWLQELSGEAVDRLAQLTARTFDDASVEVERTGSEDVNEDLDFSPADAAQQASAGIGKASKGNEDVEDYGGGRLQETVPDSYSPGAIRNFLKDYVHVVQRYISGTAELLATAGRRQTSETLASLVTKMDKFYSTVVFLAMQDFEKYVYEQAEQMAVDFELIREFERPNDYYTEEVTNVVNDLKNDLKGSLNDIVGEQMVEDIPPAFEEKPKSNILGYGSKIFQRFVNGVPIKTVSTVDQCSIVRGSNFITADGESGRAVSLNRKDNPLTSQDISGVSGRKAQEEIKQIYRNIGYCSYMVKDQCIPAASKIPLLDFGASEVVDVDNDYRQCFGADGPSVPDKIFEAKFQPVSSIVNHHEPTGATVRAILEKKLAHYFPIDAVRHVSFFIGGVGQYADSNVHRIEYPNFFELQSSGRDQVKEDFEEAILAKERELRMSRVEANWKRFEQYLAYSSPVAGRPDFWNYNEISGFSARFQGYKQAVIQLIRPELDPSGAMEDFEVVEQYLIGKSVSSETEQMVQELLVQYFPDALAKQSLDLKCDYKYDVPPINLDIQIPTVSKDDAQALVNPIAAFDVLSRLELPKFSPPSVSRECSNTVAKNTVNEVRSLRSFYFSLGGVKVDISLLHNADNFVEILDPPAVLLYFTPPPPPLPPNTNILAAIKLFDQQLEKLKNGPQPITKISKIVKPVLLQGPGELSILSQKHAQAIQEALHWLNLSIEGKHREGLSLLSKDKEMMYLVMDGEADALSFNFSQLEGNFEEDTNIASASDVLDRVREGEQAIQEQQEENRKRRELERRLEGEKPSKCGDSVPLLEWPGAVSCWLEEIIAGPLIVPTDEEPDDEDSSEANQGTSSSSQSGVGPGEIELEDTVLTMRDRTMASINLPLSIKVDWQASGSVRVVPENDGKVSVIPEEPGTGTIRASFDDGSGVRVSSAVVQVVSQQAFIRQETSGDVQIGSEDTLSFVVEVRDEKGELVDFDGSLQVTSDATALRYPAQITITDGQGTFEVRAAMKAGVSELWVGSNEVAPSSKLFVNTISGEPARVVWDFEDEVVGLDRMIEGTLSVQDAFGNPYRSEGLRLELVWDEDLQINGKTGGRGTFFVVAGQLHLRVQVSDDLYEELQSSQEASYGYGYNPFGAFDALRTFVRPRIRVDLVDGFPQIELPDEVALDIDPQYRVRFEGLPQQVVVGQPIRVQLQVLGSEGNLLLNEKEFVLQKEFGGATEYLEISMNGVTGNGSFVAGANAGTIRLLIDDPDFGSVAQEIEVVGQAASQLQLDEASYVNGLVTVKVSGRDVLGNPAVLPENLASISLLGEGAEELFKKAVVIENGLLELSIPLEQQPDRLRMELSVEGFDQTFSEVLVLQQVLTADQLKNLPWETPYVMLMGNAYGDHRVNGSVAQAMLYGPASKVQAITTEIAPHYTSQRMAQIWPSGRTSVGPEMTAEVVWENLKPVLVFSDLKSEVGRLYLNPRSLGFEVHQSPDTSFAWTKARGRGKTILVPDTAIYQSRTETSGDLLSPEGERLISFENQQVVIHDLNVQTEIFDDSGDVLVFEFSRNQQTLARWYVHFDAKEIVTGKLGALEWQFSGVQEKAFETGSFYAGESTLDERGLAIYKKGEKVRNSLGTGRSALDDVRENNGQGFAGDDKSALAFLAGNTVGESTLLQSEAIVNLGDPVISLRQIRHRDEEGGLVTAVPDNSVLAESDFSIGQLVYAPEEGQIEQLLRVDVEGDGDDDLVIVLRLGDRVVLRYLEGNGEGERWGQVSNLLDLGKDVRDVQVLQKKGFVVLYGSGQVVIEQNLQGRYVRQMVNFAALNRAQVRVTDLQVQDFDRDGFDDLLFLTGDRELWLWYGSQTLDGVQFGIREDDRKLLKVMAIRLKNPENLQTGAWLLTSTTPSLIAGCESDPTACESKYFRAYTGELGTEPTEEIDRLGLLIQQSQVEPSFELQEFAQEAQRYLVRLDQLESYANQIQVEVLNAEEGTGMRLGQQMDFQVTIVPRRTEEVFVLRYDLGADFSLVGPVQCEGCGDVLRVTKTPDSLWSLEGRAPVGRTITLNFTVEYKAFPDFSFQVMQTNADEYADIGINVSSNTSDRITVFESRGPREFAEILFGQAPQSSASAESARTLSDLMRGIGIEDTSPDELRKLLLQQQQDIEANAGDLFDTLHEDNNADGYPDIYQENPFLFDSKTFGTGQTSGAGNRLLDLFSSLIPKANAQGTAPSGPAPQAFNINLFAGLEDATSTLDNVAQDVELIIKALKCSRGCLPLPMNFAFLAPGPINIFGTPAGFDPGVPVFGVSPAPFFVWPPLVPYQATQFRFYISPTLTGGVGLSVCLGPYLLGQCMVFAIPLNQLGGEEICDAAKEGLQFIMQGIYQAVGQVNAAVDQVRNEVNKTGVVKAKKPTKVDEVEGIIGVSLGGGTHDQGINPVEPKVFLNPIPKIFVDWWDRQWEEIINSLTDLPDITVRLPNFRGALGDADYWDKIAAKADSTSFNLQQIYDLVNSLPIISLHPQVLTIQIPWIEPGILYRIEQSIYEFLYQFILELVAFLKSFNLPCNITVVRADLFNDIRSRVQEGRSEEAETRIRELKSQLESQNVDLVRAQNDFEAFAESQGIARETAALRQQYLNELQEKRTNVENLNKSYENLQNQIYALEQPKNITDIFPVLGDVLSQTATFWGEQIESFTLASAKAGADREIAEALRSCVALNIGVDLVVNVDPFVNGIKKNLEAIETWKKFPRELAKYLNVFEFYIQEVIKMIDQLTSVVLKWWSEFEKKLDLWIDAIFAFQQFIALIQLILDILKGYNKKCGLCTSDRLTLKELILKILFGVVPKFPIIDFPTWPDIRLDFSNVQLGIDVAVPVFDVKTIDLKWPRLPQITFPRFEDIQLSAGGNFSVGASVTLPEVPLVIPSPPSLPPLPPLPNIPQINLPNLPPAPEVPSILESLLPLMKIIQTILDIWCLVNKALIPVDEKLLKTQIENLTNRSLNLILPIDLLLEFDIVPGDLLSSFVPFDTIDVKSTFQAGVKVDPLPNLQQTIDQHFHQPMNLFLQQIDQWINLLRQSSQQGLNTLSGDLQNIVDQFSIEAGVQFDAGAQLNIDLERDFPELLNSLEAPDYHSELFQQREQQIASYYGTLKQDLLSFETSIQELRRQAPEDLLQRLASLPSDHVLVSSGKSVLKQEMAADKRAALYAPENMVEKQIAFLEKPKILAQLDQTRSALGEVQQQLLGTDTASLDQWGTAIVRDGEVRRIQDYPLEDPAVAVWDNDVFLGYEKGIYLKSLDGTARRPEAYTGRVRQLSLSNLQRTSVHQLQAESTASSDAGSNASTIRWTWDSPGVQDVELTVWDSVGKAQRLDSRHLRFYLHSSEEFSESEAFEVLTPGLSLIEGQEFLTQRTIRLRFGDDQLFIPAGIRFQIPSLLLREVRFSGSGTVQFENFNGQAWTFTLGEETAFEMGGIVQLEASGDQLLRIPQMISRPVITDITGTTEGALRSRVPVLRDEIIPPGIFYAVRSSTLRDTLTETELQLDPGVVFEVKSSDQWRVESGEGEVVVSDDLEYREGRLGMALMNEELLKGAFTVSFQDELIEVFPDQQVLWADVTTSSYVMTLPLGNYYGRIREVDGKRGYSEIVHAPAAQSKAADAQVIAGREQVAIPIYSPLELDGRDYVIGDLPGESYHWRLEGETELVSGQVYQHPGFSTVGTQVVELFIRDGDNDYLAKAFDVNVFLPQLRIDEELFNGSRIIRVETQPPVAGIPIGIVGSRGGVEDWLIANPDQGARLESRYYTNDQGVVQLPALEDLEGMNIVIEDGKKVARLFPNGRVVLHEEYKDSCQNEALLDRDGYMKFRVSCIDDGKLVEKFQVRMVPDLDTDVSVVQEFTAYDRGVTLRALQSSIELQALSHQDPLAPGGVQARVQNGPVLLLLSPDGKVELLERTLTIAQKPFIDGNELLVWQVLQNELPLLEFVIRGPDAVSIIDPVVRETVQGDQDRDGLLDRWEALYGVSSPDEDPDLDGLTNLQEFQRGTNPVLADTDGDGLNDGEEVDPLSAESTQRRVTFSDVPENSPYYEAVKTLSQFGFIQGYEDGTFRPDQPVTRAEALKIIMSVIRCENCEFPSQATKEELDPMLKGLQEFLEFHGGEFSSQSTESSSQQDALKFFSFGQAELTTRDPLIGSYFDVSVEDWYYYCVEIATQLGLVHGYRGFENGENALGKFIPNRGVNIAELMKIVIEAIGERAKQSERVYGPSDGWWNDPQNNYLAKAEEDLQLLLSSEDYANPLRSATRAEVAYAAWRVLKENGTLDFDEDGVPNQVDQCPCQMTNADSPTPTNGCPVEYGPALPARTREDLFAGIEITQSLECRCLIVVPADLYAGSQFFAVITGTGSLSDRVLVKSNSLVGNDQ